MSELLKTPLHARHTALNARMVPFAGYLMPVSYSGIQQEHFAVRKAAGLFDTSHMGVFEISGDSSLAYLQNLSVNDVSLLQVGQAQYSALCYANGTVVDDIFVLRTAETTYHLVVNASNVSKDFNWMQGFLIEGVRLDNVSASMGILALQGPNAPAIADCFFGTKVSDMPRNTCRWLNWGDDRILLSRTGYTGEDGFELFPPTARLENVWDLLLSCGSKFGLLPCGLGSRDTLRLESGFSLYGHELTDQTTLVEAGLSWIIGFHKPEFIGRKVLSEQKQSGTSTKLVGLLAQEKAIPREGCEVLCGERIVGRVTSGGLSPVLGQGIALAYVQTAYAKAGDVLQVQIRDQAKSFQVVSRRFVGGK